MYKAVFRTRSNIHGCFGQTARNSLQSTHRFWSELSDVLIYLIHIFTSLSCFHHLSHGLYSKCWRFTIGRFACRCDATKKGHPGGVPLLVFAKKRSRKLSLQLLLRRGGRATGTPSARYRERLRTCFAKRFRRGRELRSCHQRSGLCQRGSG